MNADTSRLGVPQEREILSEMVSMHVRIIRLLPFLDALLVGATAYDLRAIVPHENLALWIAAVMGMEITRAIYATVVFRRRKHIDPYRTYAVLIVFAGLCGLSFGLLPVLSFAYVTDSHMVLITAVLFGYAAGGVGVSPSPLIEAVWSAPIVFLLTHAFGAIYPEHAAAALILGAGFVAFLSAVAYAARNLMVQSIVIRHQRDALVKDLERSNAEVRVALLKVEESAQTRARVLAAASHDLRQPLHALSIYSAVLSAGPAPDVLEEVSRSIDQIVRSLGNLLNGLLDLSRLSVGYYTPDKSSFALDKIVRGIATEFETLAAEKSLALCLDLQPVRIHSDLTAVVRIARNLLDNAVKYTEQGQVRVSTGIENARAVLKVADTGKGIPKTLHGRVFEEFYQVDNPGRDRSKGVGLGLALVQRLCELLHAEVTLDSEPGRGSCFRVSFADVLPEPVQAAGDEAGTESPLLENTRAYLVDDESDILRSMSTLLKIWGMSAQTADSPAALEQLFIQSGVPDLLIVDLRLGGVEHGAQLARRMQLLHGAFPVLVMTGETSSQALREANEQNYPLLQKPISQEALRAAIGKLLAVRH